jgi:hypothetical protein
MSRNSQFRPPNRNTEVTILGTYESGYTVKVAAHCLRGSVDHINSVFINRNAGQHTSIEFSIYGLVFTLGN